MADLNKIVDEIKELSVVEVSELVKMLEEEFGVSAATPVMVAGPVAGATEATEEKSSFNVVLKAVGDKKIDVIKAVRDITGLSLGEAKALVEGAPKTVKEGLPADEAKAIEAKLKEAGATVELA